jgi:ParB/RepB/Spo0J family partition protein
MAGSNGKRRLENIPLNKIRENPVALRSVNRNTEEYHGLVDSIKNHGVLNPINVREVKDPQTNETYYGLVDGLQRFTASGDAGLDTIPAQVVDLEDAEILEAQIITNIHRIETKPVEYSKQLMRILTQNPTLTMSELAKKLSKSDKWLDDRLGLTKLDPKIGSLVDEDKLNLSNAYALAKLPPEEQSNFLDRALSESPQQFVPAVTMRVKEIRDARRQGRAAAPAGFQPVASLRKVSEIKQAAEDVSVASTLVTQYNLTNPVDAFKMALKWALNIDPNGIEAQKAKDEQRKKEAAVAKEKAKKEKAEKAVKEAAERVASMGLQQQPTEPVEEPATA